MADAIETQAAADAAAKAKADAEAKGQQPGKNYSEEEFKKVVEERDKAKEKARKYDDEKKKAEETKAIEEGRLKEVLTERERELEVLRAYKTQRDEAEKLEREALLGKLKDENHKAIAQAIPSLDLVRKYVEQIESQTGGPSGVRGAKVAPQDASPYKALQNETMSEYQRRLGKLKESAAKR